MSPDLPRAPRAACVVNPTKVKDAQALRQSIASAMTKASWSEPLWLETTAEDPGYAMTQQALDEGVALVLACGGDGTVRAALTVLAGSGTPLGVLPAGTGNLLARNLGIPVEDLGEALQVAMTGTDRAIDVGRVEPASGGGRPERFAVMAGVGFDAEIMRDAPEGLKSEVGWAAYLVSAVRNLRGSSMRVQVRVDGGQPIRASARTVLVANVPALQGGIKLLPDAQPDDGVLDVAIVVSHNLRDWLRVTTRVLTRRAYVDHRLSTYEGRHIQIRIRSAQPRQIDGDLLPESTKMDIQIEPGALLVRVPADHAGKSAGPG